MLPPLCWGLQQQLLLHLALLSAVLLLLLLLLLLHCRGVCSACRLSPV
jgi:hypothetical protein